MTTYTVAARRWKHGWALHTDGVGVTQSPTLATAHQAIRDYIERATGRDTSDDDIVVTLEVAHRDG